MGAGAGCGARVRFGRDGRHGYARVVRIQSWREWCEVLLEERERVNRAHVWRSELLERLDRVLSKELGDRRCRVVMKGKEFEPGVWGVTRRSWEPVPRCTRGRKKVKRKRGVVARKRRVAYG